MKVGKPKSKRVPVRLRHKIEKASASKQRKQRKLAKNDPTWRSKVKKDPGIPNLYPYKEKFLQEMEERNRLRLEENERRKKLSAAARTPASQAEQDQMDTGSAADFSDSDIDEDGDQMMDAPEDSSNPLAALLASATARANEYEKKHGNAPLDKIADSDDEWNEKDASSLNNNSSRRAYDKMFKQVVEAADVICYVLDARDPEGTRSKEVERMVTASDGGSKRLILILNKVDLIPPSALRGWLTYLRRYFPTLPLRASKEAANAHTFDHSSITVKSTSDTLFKALKAYALGKNLKRSVSVGVIGYPNVGKSSVINALASRLGRNAGVCQVGAEAGVTTGLKRVKLDKSLTLIDSPGIVFPNAGVPGSDGQPAAGLKSLPVLSSSGSKPSSGSKAEEERARLVLLNALPPREIGDPVPAVSLLIKRLSSSPERLAALRDTYGLPPLVSTLSGDVTNDFLVQVARKRGRLGRGGVPNVHAAAQTVVIDWRDGRIQGWAEPPALAATVVGTDSLGSVDENNVQAKGPAADEKQVVTQWAAEFKIEGLWGDDAFNGGGGA